MSEGPGIRAPVIRTAMPLQVRVRGRLAVSRETKNRGSPIFRASKSREEHREESARVSVRRRCSYRRVRHSTINWYASSQPQLRAKLGLRRTVTRERIHMKRRGEASHSSCRWHTSEPWVGGLLDGTRSELLRGSVPRAMSSD
jgi:hypothetical protein